MIRVRTVELAIVAVTLLLASGESWAQAPCVTSDTQSNTACGTNALHSVTTGGTDNIAV